jgi:hypothetical protein
LYKSGASMRHKRLVPALTTVLTNQNTGLIAPRWLKSAC